jgi:hypothetical protein
MTPTKMQWIAPALFALLAALVMPAAVQAQQGIETPAVSAPMAEASAAPAAPTGPIIAQAGFTRAAAARSAEPLNFQRQSFSRNERWMIIGGAMLVVGSVVDGEAGEIIMITGAVVGIIGLVRYLQ